MRSPGFKPFTTTCGGSPSTTSTPALGRYSTSAKDGLPTRRRSIANHNVRLMRPA